MDNLREACTVAIKKQASICGEKSPRTKIVQIAETEEFYIFDFYTDHVIYGGGGLLVSKKDLSVDFYCMPSYPSNIMKMIYYDAVNVEIPEEFR